MNNVANVIKSKKPDVVLLQEVDYIKLKKTDLFLELGLGCDFYLPYFKLRPELKFMYGITDTYDKTHIKNIKDKSTLPYTLSAKSAHSKIIALTFYFE